MSKKIKRKKKKIKEKTELPTVAPMKKTEYVQHVTRLKRSIRAASRTIGVAVRQSQRFAAGETPVPEPVQKLLRLATNTKTSADELELL